MPMHVEGNRKQRIGLETLCSCMGAACHYSKYLDFAVSLWVGPVSQVDLAVCECMGTTRVLRCVVETSWEQGLLVHGRDLWLL